MAPDAVARLKNQQKQWNQLAVADPLWAILADPEKRNRRWDPEEFFATGREEIVAVRKQAEKLGYPKTFHHAMDFGCGVGRNTQPLVEWFDRVTGVDISPAMLDLARKYNRVPSRCEYVLNAHDHLKTFPDASFDFIYSRIVLQHLPTPQTRSYLREFLRILRPSGLLLFQLPSRHRDSLRYMLSRAYHRIASTIFHIPDVIEMNGLPRETVIHELEMRGGRILEVTRDSGAGPDWESYLYAVTK